MIVYILFAPLLIAVPKYIRKFHSDYVTVQNKCSKNLSIFFAFKYQEISIIIERNESVLTARILTIFYNHHCYLFNT